MSNLSSRTSSTLIVFVHGFGVCTRYLEPTMALLSRDFDVARMGRGNPTTEQKQKYIPA